MKVSKSKYKADIADLYEGDFVKIDDMIGFVKCKWSIQFIAKYEGEPDKKITYAAAKKCKIIGNRFVTGKEEKEALTCIRLKK